MKVGRERPQDEVNVVTKFRLTPDDIQSINACLTEKQIKTLQFEEAKGIPNALDSDTLRLKLGSLSGDGLIVKFAQADEIWVEKMAQFLTENSTLEKLILRSVGNDACVRLAEALEKNISIGTLDFNENQITDDGCCKIANIVKKNKSIHSLYLRFNRFGSNACRELSKLLDADRSIQNLILSGNDIDDEGGTFFAQALANNTSIFTLDLSENGHDTSFSVTTCPMKVKTTPTLDLSCNKLDAKACEQFAHALQKNRSIKCCIAYRGGRGIDANFCAGLGQALNESSCCIEELDLSNWNVGPQGCIALSKDLAINCSLHTLHLNTSRMGDIGCDALAEAFRANKFTGIHTLKLNGNSLSSSAVENLARSLQGVTSIHVLELSQNHFGNGCCAAIGNLLKNSKSIQVLDLSDNWIDSAGLAAMVSTNNGIDSGVLDTTVTLDWSIKKLMLSHNKIGSISTNTREEKSGSAVLASAPENSSLGEKPNNEPKTGDDETQKKKKPEEKGCAAIAKILTSCRFLEIIDLSYNKIGDNGCPSIAEALEGNSNIRRLNVSKAKDLWGGRLDLDLKAASFNVLPPGTLDLSYNPFGDIGYSALTNANALANIEVLDRSGRGTEAQGNSVLTNYLKKNPSSLKYVDFSEYGVSLRMISENIDFNKLEKIGQGSYAYVYILNEVSVVKRLTSKLKGDMLERSLREFQIWSDLKNARNIVPFEGLVLPGKETDGTMTLAFVMPRFECTLRNHIKEKKGLSFQEKIFLLQQVCFGLCTLHEKRIIHRDLHSNNVLIRGRRTLQVEAAISDLGMCVQLPETQDESKAEHQVSFGTDTELGRITPQEVENNEKCVLRSDIYAFGFLMWEVMYEINRGIERVDITTPWKQFLKVQMEEIEKETPFDENQVKFNAIMWECLQDEYTERPTSTRLKIMLQDLAPENNIEVHQYPVSGSANARMHQGKPLNY
jgi:serine/threonine protein kinase/Ran GTPase-activating protein (RanGAP) involved in mRNA processing and transport